MRAVSALLIPLCLVATGARAPSAIDPPGTSGKSLLVAPSAPAAPLRFAALGDSLPGLLIDLVNDSIKGEIRPRKVAYRAPATAILDDIVVVDPRGKPVAQVDHLEATASLTAILAGRIEIDSLKVRAPRLLLELKNGKLNLAEAFEPKKPSGGDAPNLTVVIEKFNFSGGGLRFRDGKNITVVANDARATGSVRIKLAEKRVRVVVKSLQVGSGEVKLKDLDIPFSGVQVAQVDYRNNRIDLTSATGTVLGKAFASAGGNIGLRKKAGRLNLSGKVVGKASLWPKRLAAPPFPLPAFNTTFSVRGPFANPTVALNGRSQSFRAYDYAVDGVAFQTRVTKDVVTLQKTDVALKGGGTLKATGSIALATLGLDLNVAVDSVPLSTAAAPAKLDPPPRGIANGRLLVTGKADGKAPIDVAANLVLSRPRAFNLNLPKTLKTSALLSITPERIDVRRSKVETPSKSLVATAAGAVFLKRETLSLELNVDAATPLTFVKEMPKELGVGRASLDGRVEGPFKNVRVTGAVTATKVEAYGAKSPRLTAQLRVDKRRLVVDAIRGNVLEGKLKARVALNLAQSTLPLNASVSLVDADIAQFDDPVIADLGVQGRGTLNAVIEGIAKNPTVLVTAEADGVVLQTERLGHVQTRLNINKSRLVATDVRLDGPLITAQSKVIQVGFDDRSVGGRVQVARVALDQLHATKDLGLGGSVNGIVDLAGTFDAPRLFGRLDIDSIAVDTNTFGDGPVDVCLRPTTDDGTGRRYSTARGRCLHLNDDGTPVIAPGAVTDATKEASPLVVEVSGHLRGSQGFVALRGAYDLDKKTVHARARVREVELGPLLKTYVPSIGPLEGVASARVSVFGPIDALDANIDVLVPDVATTLERPRGRNDPSTLVDDLRTLQSRGAIRATGTLRSGQLDAKVCGFPDRSARLRGAMCPDGSRIQIRATGPVRQQDGAFDLRLQYDVLEEKLSTLLPSLRDNDLKASAHVDGKARLWRKGAKDAPAFVLEDLPEQLAKATDDRAREKAKKKAAQAKADARAESGDEATASPEDGEANSEAEAAALRTVGFDVDLRVIDQSILAPGAPRATLARVARVHVDSAGTVTLRSPLRYEIGDSEVVIKGGLTPDRIDATVDGTLALALLKLFPESISNASGTALAKLTFEGPYRPLPRIQGEIIPAPGAFISPRGLGQRVQFASGKLVFTGRPDNPLEQRLRAEELAVTVDDGAASLDGDVIVQLPATSSDQVVVSDWNLRASGVGIRFRRASTFIESAFDVTLKGPQARPVLAGNVEVTDGFVREQFELKNFVLTSAPDSPPTPLVETLRPASLENLVFNVNVGVRNFRARADLATFGLDAIMVGDLRLTKSARLYAISGAIEVAQGDIRFPYAQFDIEQTRIEFPPASAGLEPKIYLDARADLQSPKNGLDTDLSCELQLDGDIESLKLELSAPDAPRSVSETDLLKFVLFGVPLTAGDLSADPDAALRAVSSELTSDVSRELEQAIQDNFGAALQLQLFAESTRAGAGLRYEVGSRLDVEGETGVAYGDGTNGLGGLAGEVRVRLLLFDHLPGLLGEEAAVEGQIKTSGAVATDATRGELRLTWRVFQQ